jgi:hypothetical protein
VIFCGLAFLFLKSLQPVRFDAFREHGKFSESLVHQPLGVLDHLSNGHITVPEVLVI